VSDAATRQPYPDLEALLGRQKVVGILCTLEVDEVGPGAAAAIEKALDRALTSFQRLSGWPRATWSARDRRLQWIQNQLQYEARIHGELERDHRRAADHAADKLRQLMAAVGGETRARFAALVLDLQFPAMDLPPVGPYLASFVRWPVPAPEDAEWRVATRRQDRYFVNWFVGQYEAREYQVEVPAGSREVSLSQPNAAVLQDRGLRLRVDANTRVNIAEGKGAVEILEADLGRLRDLAAEAVDTALQGLRRGA
jgi:hypothetical protein